MSVIRSSDDDGSISRGISFSAAGRKDDGHIEVVVADDAMSATADLYPPLGDGKPISSEYAAELLARLGLNYGVIWDELSERILEANTERRVIHGVIIARGSPPVAERPEHIIPRHELIPGFSPVPDEEQKVDWKSRKPYSIVKMNDIVATVENHRAGVFGSNVYGKSLPYGKESPEGFTLGKNVERRDDAIVALVDGRLGIEGSRIFVDEVLVVKGDVDYRIGHIMFPGDVLIEGGVCAGFKVYSGGSISIKDTMDAFDVSARKDLLCAQGIIGKEQGLVRVGGTLKAKFVENARCAVRGDADISGSVVGSRLYVLGRLNMGDKGRIVGGETYATHGITCGWIGGSTRPVTHVSVGIDFTMQQKLDTANEAVKELSIKLSRLEDLYKQRPEDSIGKLRDEAAERLRTLAANIAELAKRVDIDDSAMVEAHGGVYPGTIITICHMRVTIEELLKKTRFRLDTVANKILIEH
ncbi:MAG: DUF342 domain-containing protein [Spirochaetales bacterium]|nr:MAG: DUF342 domain-containing protein [Spirochaetales bacterium]